MTRTLLRDDFVDLDVGMFSAPVGPHTEYHFLPEAAPKGHWAVACFAPGREAGEAWHVAERDGVRFMSQTRANKRDWTHPMLIAGDELWGDSVLTVAFTPRERGRSGVAFRYRNSRCHYFFGFDKSGVLLSMVRHAKGFGGLYEKPLARVDCDWEANREYTAVVGGEGTALRGEIEGLATLEADDDTYGGGKIGLTCDVPTDYRSVTVETADAALERINSLREKRERELDELREANPKPVLWKKIATPGFGVGRNLRFGDLDGDGETDVLIGQMVHHGPGDAFSELSCLTAMNFDGEILWQVGEPDEEKWRLTNDVSFQIHDIDGDGRNEVVYCMNQEIIVADGATGETKYKTPTPKSHPPADKFPRILGDCLFFCDLRGSGRPADMLIKDRYWRFWLLDERLQPLWDGACRTGHYPWAADVDGDGHDELVIGYSMWDHDGRMLWNLEADVPDHADGVAVVNFLEPRAGDPRVLFAASNSGLFFTDLDGKIVKHHPVGHAQNPAVAKFRDDLPGLQTVCINFWGNQGILHFLDATHEIYHDCEPNNFGSMCLPINWTGEGVEYFVHSPNVALGGMFDGWGRAVVMFPDDGHPDMCNAVLDVTGDCRDEVVVWDQHEIWVYTQDDAPKPGRLYQPRRNPLYNYSNYQATVSLPGWSGQPD